MRKLGKIWDYVMRRKPLFGAGLVLILGVVLGGRLLAPTQNFGRSQESQASSDTSLANSLILQLASDPGTPSYQLVFDADFATATISISEAPLASEAYVRILTANEELLAGEYTVARDNAPLAPEPDVPADNSAVTGILNLDTGTVNYVFADAPKTYTVKLLPGYIIEVHSSEARFISTLSGKVATAFQPTTTIERYIVTTTGLRKLAWSDTEGEEAMYGLLRDYIGALISNYQAQISDEILNNKNLDLARKNEIVSAYYQLRPDDQMPYREFINHLLRGGSPILTYLGEKQYDLGAQVDWRALIEAYDNEDGVLSAEQVEITSDVDWSLAGTYTVTYTATDSDGNVSSLTVTVQVGAPERPEVTPQPDPGLEPEESLDSPSDTGTLGGGTNLADSTPSSTTTTVWSNATTSWTADAETANSAEELDNTTAAVTRPATSTNSTVAQRDAIEDAAKDKAKFPLKQIILIGFGVLLFYGLIRFIFDHYVR